jgi:hypothetical protein
VKTVGICVKKEGASGRLERRLNLTLTGKYLGTRRRARLIILVLDRVPGEGGGGRRRLVHRPRAELAPAPGSRVQQQPDDEQKQPGHYKIIAIIMYVYL